jgi:hypothetical protein
VLALRWVGHHAQVEPHYYAQFGTTTASQDATGRTIAIVTVNWSKPLFISGRACFGAFAM